jgi:putative glutamine amidotransferase
MKPVIGINCSLEGENTPRLSLNSGYYEAVKRAGGVPVLLAPLEEAEDIEGLLKGLDGLILSGGEDLWPERYGQRPHPKTNLVSKERDIFDFKLVRQALDMNMPILGICLGEQLLNVALGGSLIQDLPSQSALDGAGVAHNSKTVHKIKVGRGTHLYELLGTDTLLVNSSHHQAVDRLGKGMKVSARAEDGVIEAIESTKHSLVIGVQWHPERMLGDFLQKRLFTTFLEAVRGHATKR